MIYRRLVLRNFGVYRGEQEFKFSRDQGVWIVYGQNSRGKTTLLNAFRFALYGEYLGRSSQRPLDEVVNELHVKEAEANGTEPGFTVQLGFEHEGVEYELARSYRNGQTSLQLRKSGTMLSLDASERELREVAPPSISRFFLFDGELLKQYEELADESSDAARRLREEVNRILGVSAILRTVEDLSSIHSDEDKQLAKAAAADKKSQDLGRTLESLQVRRDALVAEKKEAETELKTLLSELDTLEGKLEVHAQSREIMGRLDAARSTRRATLLELDMAKNQLQEVSPDVWKSVLKADIQDRVDELGERRERLSLRRAEAYANQHTLAHLQSSEECPVCLGQLDERAHAAAVRRAQESFDEDTVEALDEESEQLRTWERVLRRIGSEANPGVISDREKRVADLKLQREGLDATIKELEEELAGVDESEVKRLQSDRDKLVQLINGREEHLASLITDIADTEKRSQTIRKEISAKGVSLEPEVELRAQISGDLVEMFKKVVETYQTVVLGDVEAEATKLFLRMRSEEDFSALKVSDGYGVQILDRDGEVVRGHSAGYAHLVALALIGALQRCSPVQGPIIMDSPFGRLDAGHTRQVVAALPEVAKQVVLLAFESEFDRDAATEELGTMLVAEHVLMRGSAAKETLIQPREEY